MHAFNHFKVLRELGKTVDNLEAAIGGETYEVEEMYDTAKAAVESGDDAEAGQVCEVCGWTGEGEPPDECPLCKAKREKFVTF